MILPPGSSARAEFLHELAHRTVPSFDFFLFSLLAGLCLGAALLLDSPALVFLAALLAPFMAPALGISLGTITGAIGFILQSLGSLGIGSLIMLLCGMVAGWAVHLLPQGIYQQALLHSRFTWADFLVLGLGAGLTAYLIVRSPNQKPLVTSIAIAYELYLPAGVAGFGVSSGINGLWQNGTELFLIHLVWAALIGTLVLGFCGLRPLNAAGYLLGIGYALVGVAAIIFIYSNQAAAPGILNPQTQAGVSAGINVELSSATPSPTGTPSPSITPTPLPPTVTPTPTRTRTLIPTRTQTQTITPAPTPVWARINASQGNGALVRGEPNFDSGVEFTLLNETLVEVLPDVINDGSIAWVHIRTANGKEGWIVRTLLRTATPAPGW